MQVSDENRQFMLEIMAALSAIGWVTYIVVKNHLIPEMTGVVSFVSALPLIHRAHSVLNNFTSNKYSNGNGNGDAPAPVVKP